MDLKEKLKASRGKVKHYASTVKHDAASKVKEAGKNVKTKYDSGVVKTQNTAMADKMADLTGGLTKKSEEELLQDKDGTFRTARKVIINAGVVIAPFIISLPIKMIDEAIQRKVDLKHAKEYDRVYEREILWCDNEIERRRKEGTKVDDLVKYRENLKKARVKNAAYIESIEKAEAKTAKANKATKEALEWPYQSSTMHPALKFHYMKEEYYADEDSYTDDLCKTFFEAMQWAARRTHYPDLVKEEEHPVAETTVKESQQLELPEYVQESRKSAIIMGQSFFLNSIRADKTLTTALENVCTSGGKSLFTTGGVNKINLVDFDYDKISRSSHDSMNRKLKVLTESLNKKIGFTGCEVHIGGNAETPAIVLEGETVRKVVQTAQDVVRKAVNVGRDVVPDESPTKTADRVVEPVDNAINKFLDDVKSALSSDTRDRIKYGEYRVKLTKIIAKAIAYGAMYYIHPALAAIAFLGKMAFDKYCDQSERTKIQHDIDTELEITKEKINDAKAKGDNEAKYKLMRIQKALEAEQARIKLHMDK